MEMNEDERKKFLWLSKCENIATVEVSTFQGDIEVCEWWEHWPSACESVIRVNFSRDTETLRAVHLSLFERNFSFKTTSRRRRWPDEPVATRSRWTQSPPIVENSSLPRGNCRSQIANNKLGKIDSVGVDQTKSVSVGLWEARRDQRGPHPSRQLNVRVLQRI